MVDRVLLESGDLLLLETGDAILLESSAAVPESPKSYTLPSNFNDALGIIITDDNGAWTVANCGVDDIDFTKSSLFPSYTIYYVDYQSGNDANDGLTEANAVKTFDQAATLAQALAQPAEIVILDEIIGQNSLTTTAKTFPHHIKVSSGSVSGRTIISNIDEDTTISWTDNADGTFSATTGTEDFPACFDNAAQDADGIATPMQSVASGAACVATAGSFFWDGVDTLMVHMTDDREPDSDFIYCPAAELGRMHCKTSRPDGIVIYENLTAYHNGGASGGGGGFGATCTVNTGPNYNSARLGIKNCYSAGSNGNGFGILDFSIVIMEGCVTKYNRADGYNYHVVAGTDEGRYMAVYENNCKATDCGYDGVFQDQPTRETSSNATSIHDSIRSFRIGGYYETTYGPVVADVNGSYNFLVDCYASDPGLAGASAVNAAYYHSETAVNPNPVGSYLAYCSGNAITSGSGAVILSEDGTYGHISYWSWQGATPVTSNGSPSSVSSIGALGFEDYTGDDLIERRRRVMKRRRANAALARPRKEVWAGRPVNNPKYR